VSIQRNPNDDPTIPDDAVLWRRIHKNQAAYDKNLGRKRPSSEAFKDSSDGTPMSVILAEVVLESGRKPEDIVRGSQDHGLASLPASTVRENGLGILKAPTPEEPAHAEVLGDKSKKISRELAKRCEWVIMPPED
jgi:hypothetical protein